MFSSVAFVPLNVLERCPVPADVTQEDLQQLRGRLERTMRPPAEDDDSRTSEEEAEAMQVDKDREEAVSAAEDAAHRALTAAYGIDPELDEAMKELDFENYDSEDDVAKTSFLDHLVDFQPGERPPRSHSSDEDESDDDSEDEVVEYDEGDVVFLATKTEDILSSIEVWLYEEADDSQGGNLFVHHDFPLGNFPLCCAYLDVQPSSSEKCNLVAVGCMECDIELYNLDVLDPVAPVATLAIPFQKKRVSTMSLSVNEEFRNVMASGGDDKRVRVWDVDKGTPTADMKLHKGTIQSVEWNPNEPPILLSGGHDKKCVMTDVRSPDGKVLIWTLGADNEAVAWCLHQTTSFLVSDEEGTVLMLDARNGSTSDPVFALAAHKVSTTVVSVCPLQSKLFMTGSEDGKVKIWSVDGSEPQLVDKKKLDVGEVLAGGFCRHAGHLLVGAGDNGTLRVWDVRASADVVRHLPGSVYVPQIYKRVR